MRRTILFVAGAFLLLLSLAATPAVAGASGFPAGPTYHGTFSAGIAVNNGTGAEGYAEGSYDIRPSGVWNVAMSERGPEITGALRGLTCPFAPCFRGWVMNLSGGTPWVEVSPADPGADVFTSFVDWGQVKFWLTLRVPGSGATELEMSITGCPHGWSSMTVW